MMGIGAAVVHRGEDRVGKRWPSKIVAAAQDENHPGVVLALGVIYDEDNAWKVELIGRSWG